MKAAAINLNIEEPPEPTPWCTILALVIGHCLGDCQMTHFQLYFDLVQPDPTVTDITNWNGSLIGTNDLLPVSFYILIFNFGTYM